MDSTSNPHVKHVNSEAGIAACKVTNATQRLQCLPDIAGRDCVVLEHTIYDMLSSMSEDYDGGFWEYYELSNGGFYMAPKSEIQFRMLCDGNGFEGVVNANTAGIIATAMAYSHLSFRPRGDRFARAYELLSDFIFQHSDAPTIRAALD